MLSNFLKYWRAMATSWEQGTKAILEHVRQDPAWRVSEEWANEPVELPEHEEEWS